MHASVSSARVSARYQVVCTLVCPADDLPRAAALSCVRGESRRSLDAEYVVVAHTGKEHTPGTEHTRDRTQRGVEVVVSEQVSQRVVARSRRFR